MKTRFTFALLLGMILTGGAKAQPSDGKTAKEWFPAGAAWSFESGSSMRNVPVVTKRFVVEKDTVVGGKTCRLICGGNRPEIVYEEGGIVYYYDGGKFRKIYNFNVKEGDMFNLELRARKGAGADGALDTVVTVPCNVEKVTARVVDGVELKEVRVAYSTKMDVWNGASLESTDISGTIAYIEKLGVEWPGRISGELLPHIVPNFGRAPEDYHNVLVRYREPGFRYVNDTWLQNLGHHPVSAFDADTAAWIHIVEDIRANEFRTDTVRMQGDTIIDKVAWRKIESPRNYIGEKDGEKLLIRTDGRKVLLWLPEFEKELLLYDFSLSEKDSFPAWGTYVEQKPLLIAVDKVETASYCGEERKKISFGDIEIAEGIGNLRHVLFPLIPIAICCADDINLAACTADGRTIYHNPKYANEKGEVTYVANEPISAPLPEVKAVYSGGSIHVTAATDAKFDVAVYNVQGQAVAIRNGNTRQATIPIADMPRGVYFVHTMLGGKPATKKILKD